MPPLIFVVMETWKYADNGNDRVCGVYSTREKAEEKKALLDSAKGPAFVAYDIEEFELDMP